MSQSKLNLSTNNDINNKNQSEQSIHENDQSKQSNSNTIVQEDELPPVSFDIPSIPKLTEVFIIEFLKCFKLFSFSLFYFFNTYFLYNVQN